MKTKKWKDLYGAMPAERRAKVETRVQEALQEMPLHRLREARRLTQKQIAETMHIDQSRVSKIERRTDAYVSTLAISSLRSVASLSWSPDFRTAA